MMLRFCLPLALLCAVALAACGSDSDEPASTGSTTSTTAVAGRGLGAVKDYLLAHTERLVGDTKALAANAEAYAAAREAGDDAQVAALVRQGQELFRRANPAYEEMEGVVAGVPELADYDVIIDAGGDASDPENAVPFSITTADGKTFRQPGNFNYLIETAVFGTESKWSRKADLDGDGEVAFGEALPDPAFYVAATKKFAETATELDRSARAWTPTPQDAFTALVVMTPTMSEYFNAWKSSRFIAGEQSDEKAFVAASRLQDIADILGGLQLVYDNVKPSIASVDAQQAEQTGTALKELTAFAERLRDAEQDGRKFTAADADTLGSEAQRKAEAIAGQVSQAAGRLGIELES